MCCRKRRRLADLSITDLLHLVTPYEDMSATALKELRTHRLRITLFKFWGGPRRRSDRIRKSGNVAFWQCAPKAGITSGGRVSSRKTFGKPRCAGCSTRRRCWPRTQTARNAERPRFAYRHNCKLLGLLALRTEALHTHNNTQLRGRNRHARPEQNCSPSRAANGRRGRRLGGGRRTRRGG